MDEPDNAERDGDIGDVRRTSRASTRLMALLFTDIVGSVDHKSQMGMPKYVSMLGRHDALFSAIVDSYRGAKILNDLGDGFMTRFDSTSNAVKAALRFHTALARQQWGSERIQVRIGLHLGEITELQTDMDGKPKLVGLAADLSSRLMSLALPGQTLLTRAAFDDGYQYVRTDPDDEGTELQWISHGSYLFSGTEEPLEVFEVGSKGAPFKPPPDTNKARRRQANKAKTAPPKTIAVLPFSDRTPDSDQEYFCDGLADTLINALTQVPGLRVAVRDSTFRLYKKGLDVCDIGRQLNVGTVLEGSIQKAGDGLRITARLINVSDGCYFWSQQYNGHLEDTFEIQDEIARTIMLKLTLAESLDTPLVKHHTENVEAYNLYVKGRFFWYKRHQGRLHDGIECFKQAIQIDPSYALAYAGLSDSYSVLGLYGFIPPRQAYEEATTAALKALELDRLLPETHCSIGAVRLWLHLDRQGALKAFQRAVELNPDDAWAHSGCGAAYALLNGHAKEAAAAAKHAQDLDFLSPIVHATAALTLYWTQQYDKALAACSRAVELEPDHAAVLSVQGTIYMGMARYAAAAEAFERGIELTGRTSFFHLSMLAAALGASDRVAEARQLLEELESRSEREYVAPVYLAWVYLGLGDSDRAAEMYKRALDERSIHFWNPTDPLFDGVRLDPSFQQFCKQAGY